MNLFKELINHFQLHFLHISDEIYDKHSTIGEHSIQFDNYWLDFEIEENKIKLMLFINKQRKLTYKIEKYDDVIIYKRECKGSGCSFVGNNKTNNYFQFYWKHIQLL